VKFTDEQQEAIESNEQVVVVDAKAGTGKTTTAVGFAHARPTKRLLYMAFNKTAQMDAQARFGSNSNTECRTTHSLAWAAFGRLFQSRTTFNWRALDVRSELNLPNIRAAAMVQAILTRYLQSRERDIGVEHAKEAETRFNATEVELGEAIANARTLWRRMQDRSDTVQMPHDAYLKMWALSNPRLEYDYILCDEWQDANPVTAQVVEMQRHSKIVILGDPHQSIYAFRGAVNAMNQFAGARRVHLTKTWRFGPKVAHVANTVLAEFKREQHLIQAMGVDAPYRSGSAVTKLARTNAQLFADAIAVRGAGVHWVGGIEKYELDKILDAYFLFAGKRDRIVDPFLRHFATFGELATYGEEAKDREAKVLAEVVEKYTHDIPSLIGQVKANEVKDPAQAQLLLTTAHKAKGLDWDYVQLADDFEILAETEALLAQDPNGQIEEQEINLLYVALTRAKRQLALNEDTRKWLEQLPAHQRARAQAAARARAKQNPSMFALP
jgi:F-box protein, helicase, 18